MPGKASAGAARCALAIHGGAGTAPRPLMSAERERRYRAGLEAALDGSFAVLERGGSALDAVTAAVRTLEDDPSFNAGHGAALTRDGAAELDAAIMDGRQMRAGAVASVRHVKNPIELARRVMEKSRHVLLVGAGAEEFALEEGLALVANHYFRTPERLEQLESEQRGRHVSGLFHHAPCELDGILHVPHGGDRPGAQLPAVHDRGVELGGPLAGERGAVAGV